MNYRKLRIAWSVFWGVVAVLLVVLWVRSYWQSDSLSHYNSPINGITSGSERGVVYLSQTPDIAHKTTPRWEWRNYEIDYSIPQPFPFEFNLLPASIAAPHWFVALLLSIVGAVPWLPLKRFSLRTLLIAMTLVALVLGLIVWVSS